MKTYKHLFFDLDRTLWDFDSNNLITFQKLYESFRLSELGIVDFDLFFETYKKFNLQLWEAYKKREITKAFLSLNRFHQTLKTFGVDDEALASAMAQKYIEISPLQTKLYPNTIPTLEKLFGRYQLHIITNGFEEIQDIKLRNSGIDKYFDKIITSERAGFQKPDSRIFAYALQLTGAQLNESLIIGDDPEADILGAARVGMDQIWVKHKSKAQALTQATYTVETLEEISNYL